MVESYYGHLNVRQIDIRYDPNYPHFGLYGMPHEHKQHPNQRAGLDLYIHAINLDTGELCHKKLYENKKGLYFKHTGYSPMYLSDFTSEGKFVPFQFQMSIEDAHKKHIEEINSSPEKLAQWLGQKENATKTID